MHRHKEGGTETYTINDIRAFEDLFGFAVSDATQGRPAPEFPDSSLIARGGLGSGEHGCGMDAPPLWDIMMHSVRTVLLCCCRHAPAASQCPPAPEPRACLLSRCLVDYLPHGATGAVRLERYRRHGWQVLPTCRNCHCCVHSSSHGPQYTTVDLCVWLWSAV